MSMPGSSGSSLVRSEACPPLNRRWKKRPNSRSTAWSVALNCSPIVLASSSASARRSLIARSGVRKTLLRLAARPFRGERALASELRRTTRVARVRRRLPRRRLGGLEPRACVTLLRGESAKALFLVGEAPLGRADLLVERVAKAHVRCAALLARRRVEPRVLGPSARRIVRLDRTLLRPLGDRERVGGARTGGGRGIPFARELLAPAENVATLALDRRGARLARAHEVTHVRFGGRQLVRGSLGLAAPALGDGQALFVPREPPLGLDALFLHARTRALCPRQLVA